MSRVDGQRPDGQTALSWAKGRCTVWDFNCPNTLDASHLNYHAVPGQWPTMPRAGKQSKKLFLSHLYRFMPVVVETLGALGDEAITLVYETLVSELLL